MNYQGPDLIDKLAAEYALCTLHGGARRRFERLLIERADVQRAVWRWESRFGEVASSVAPAAPPTSSWDTVCQRLGHSERRSGSSPRFWRYWSIASTLACIALLALLLVPQLATESVFSPDHVAVVDDADNSPLWVITADLQTGELAARAVNATAAELDQVFELWMLPNEGEPQSIGLLPVNNQAVQHQLPAGLRSLLRESRGLAISIEPPGGSPTGLPTGPVVHTATVLEL